MIDIWQYDADELTDEESVKRVGVARTIEEAKDFLRNMTFRHDNDRGWRCVERDTCEIIIWWGLPADPGIVTHMDADGTDRRPARWPEDITVLVDTPTDDRYGD